MDPVLIWLYPALLVAAGVAGAGLHGPRRAPIATMVAFGLAAVPSLLQITVAPGLFETLYRDRSAIADGEVWRLLTSFAVQDSGWSGTIFNLLALAILGTTAAARGDVVAEGVRAQTVCICRLWAGSGSTVPRGISGVRRRSAGRDYAEPCVEQGRRRPERHAHHPPAVALPGTTGGSRVRRVRADGGCGGSDPRRGRWHTALSR